MTLGIRANLAQFSLLVLVNGLVGAMVGLERTVLPMLAEDDFGLAAKSAMLSFIAVFGLSKAAANYVAGRLSDLHGRRRVLIAGWLVALPVPFLLLTAPSWSWVLAANALLGVSQGLTWSTTVIMKIDLAGPRQRGLAMGVNEFAGYLAVGASALASGYLAATYGLGPGPFALGIAYAAVGLLLSVVLVRETRSHAVLEARAVADAPSLSPRQVFRRTSLTDPNLSSASQAGLVNNLNDGLAWGLFPLVYAAAGMDLTQIAQLAALYPAVWGVGQLFTGATSDVVGRKPMIVAGMTLQSLALATVALAHAFGHFALASILLGAGTAMVYPALLAAIGDAAHPSWRATAVGVYRLWRDAGYAVGALVAGLVADAFGLTAAVWVVAALTAASGVVAQIRMEDVHSDRVAATPG
ncbi:MAG: MFS transporter [Deltaproteobacteria bacterium]|nr:MAG: MFS transporter [Deltaproteobacteria bacterium]